MNKKKGLYLSEVFGISGEPTGSYTQRFSADNLFIQSLSENKHIALYGPSGSGKSLLLKSYLQDLPHIYIKCAKGNKRFDIYRVLLRLAGLNIELNRKRLKGKHIGAKLKFFEGGLSNTNEIQEKVIDFDLCNTNDIIDIIQKGDVDKIIILDDFHRIKNKVKREIVNDLKSFSENTKIRFILVGIWKKKNLLLHLNGNIEGYINFIDTSIWNDNELEEIIDKGRKLLNIDFEADKSNEFTSLSLGNPALLQKLVYNNLIEAGITESEKSSRDIKVLPRDYLGKLLMDNKTRYSHIVEKYINYDISQKYNPLEFYVGPYVTYEHVEARPPKYNICKWIMIGLAVFEAKALYDGIGYDELYAKIEELFDGKYKLFEKAELISRIRQIERIQRMRDIEPRVFSYCDQEEKVYVIDPLFIHFLKSKHFVLKNVYALLDNHEGHRLCLEYLKTRKPDPVV